MVERWERLVSLRPHARYSSSIPISQVTFFVHVAGTHMRANQETHVGMDDALCNMHEIGKREWLRHWAISSRNSVEPLWCNPRCWFTWQVSLTPLRYQHLMRNIDYLFACRFANSLSRKQEWSGYAFAKDLPWIDDGVAIPENLVRENCMLPLDFKRICEQW